MSRPPFLSLLLLVAGGCWSEMWSQSLWDARGNVGLSSGMHWNVFHAPSEYVHPDGNLLREDSLLLQDAWGAWRTDVDLTRRGDRGKWVVSMDLDRLAYRTVGRANATGVDVRARRYQAFAEGWEGLGWVRFRHDERLGLNVLGDELQMGFTFNQWEGLVQIERSVAATRSWRWQAEWGKKDYLETGHAESLDQTEWSTQWEGTWGSSDGPHGRLRSAVEWREKQYHNWLSDEELALNPDPLAPTPFLPFDPTADYPMRRWRYQTVLFRYDLPEWERGGLRADLRLQRRADVRGGDFGFNDTKFSIRSHAHAGKWQFASSAGYSRRNYTDRLAEQATGVPYPTLRYRYLRFDAEARRPLIENWSVVAQFEGAWRLSNTTATTTRVRRSYRTALASIGLLWEF